MLFDTHAHLDDEAFALDKETVISGLPGKGIARVMNVGYSLESSRECVATAEKYPFVYAAVGTHPDTADEVNEDVLAEYAALCRHEKVKAIGEIGLDYHYETIPRQVQKQAFSMQMELAQQLCLPVIVHERDAHADGLEIVKQFPGVTGVFHCYSGAREMALQLVKMGWYIGFTGVLTFKNARVAVEVASALPIERIVLETDCPYMAPEPFRGKRNDPGYLYRMAEKLAEIKGLSVAEIHKITTENACRLYRMEKV